MKETDIKMLAGFPPLIVLSCNIVGVFHRRPSKKIRKDEPYGWVSRLPRKTDTPCLIPDEEMWEMEVNRPYLPGFVQMPANMPISRYWGLAQNDAIIIAAKLAKRQFSLTFGNHELWMLASALFVGPCPDFSTSFPVKITFDNLELYRVFRLVEQGAIQYIRASQANLSRRVYDLVCIEPIAIDSSGIDILVIANGASRGPYRGDGPDVNPYFDEFLIQMRARDIHVEENHRDNWLRIFGQEKLWIYERYLSLWPKPMRSAIDFEEWLIEIGAISSS